MAICILKTVTESHEFIEHYFATPIKSPAMLNRYPFCHSTGKAAKRKGQILLTRFTTPMCFSCAVLRWESAPRPARGSGFPALPRQGRDHSGDDNASL